MLPTFSQLLPAPLEPEGLLADPAPQPPRRLRRSRLPVLWRPLHGDDLRVEDRGANLPADPLRRRANGAPIPWSALSGLTEIPERSASFRPSGTASSPRAGSSQSTSPEKPAVFKRADHHPAGGGATNYDPEGLAYTPDGSLWVATEGNDDDSRAESAFEDESRDRASSNGVNGLPDDCGVLPRR